MVVCIYLTCSFEQDIVGLKTIIGRFPLCLKRGNSDSGKHPKAALGWKHDITELGTCCKNISMSERHVIVTDAHGANRGKTNF